MSNKQNLTPSKVSFDLAVNLHYGAFHLLYRFAELMRNAGCLSPSEFERIDKFVSFAVSLVERGHRRYYPELYSKSKHSEDVNSQS